jgi:hypothetical protein
MTTDNRPWFIAEASRSCAGFHIDPARRIERADDAEGLSSIRRRRVPTGRIARSVFGMVPDQSLLYQTAKSR